MIPIGATFLILAAAPVWPDSLSNDADTFKGTIFTVGKNSLSVQKDRETTDFVVSAETKIDYEGMPVMLKDLKPGQRVNVTAVRKSGKLVARKISARRPMPKPPR